MAWMKIERGKVGGDVMPNNIIRFTQSSLAISPNISERFQSARRTAEDGRETVRLDLAVDPENNLIKIVPNTVTGFSFGTKGGRALIGRYPRNLAKLNLPKGDYALVDERELVFELAQ